MGNLFKAVRIKNTRVFKFIFHHADVIEATTIKNTQEYEGVRETRPQDKLGWLPPVAN